MFESILGRAYRLFISRRFAISLLIAVSFLLLMGILLPTLSYHEPSEMVSFSKEHPILFELGKVFNPPTLTTSWSFLFLTGLLMLSTVLCCFERIRNREYQDPYGKEPKFFRHKVEFSIASNAEDSMASSIATLRQYWWRLGKKRVRENGVFIEGRKGAFGFWGSIIFHLGFMIILVGVIMSSSTRFSGKFLVAEGQELPLLIENMTTVVREPAGGYELPGYPVYLESFKAEIVDERFPVEYRANLKVSEPSGIVTSKKILINEAIKINDIAILLENYGFAPHIMVKDPKGQTPLDAFINLRGRIAGSRDSFKVPKTKLSIDTIFFPNRKNKTSLVPQAPYYTITVKNKDKKVFQGDLHQGKSVKFDGYTMSFPETRYWAYFQVNRDLGIGVLFWGFMISFIGVVIRFVSHDRQVSIRLKSGASGTEVLVSGRSKYFPAIFKGELTKLAKSIEDEQTGGPLNWDNLKKYFSG